jgi:hypothetical protein
MPTAQRLALEAALQAAWRRLHACELLADEADLEGVREDIAQMKYHLLCIQEEMLKDRRKRVAIDYERRMEIHAPPLVNPGDLPF